MSPSRTHSENVVMVKVRDEISNGSQRDGLVGGAAQVKMVGGTGIEPVTPSMSTKCSPAELTARSAWEGVIHTIAA